MKISLKTVFKHDLFFVIILWVFLLSFNLTKAFHIDDTFHLEAAKYLIDNPSKPMSGDVVWGNSTAKFSEYNQPPFFFYIIAIYGNVFGFSEISIHLLLSIFTFFALFFFQKLTYLLKVKYKKILISLFAFSPAFIVNQNIMIDVPILSILLGVLYFLIKAINLNKIIYYLYAIILFTIGIMFKYTVIPIFVVFIVVIIIHKHYKKIFILLIPISALIVWSVWNKYEFNAIHILERPQKDFNYNSIITFITCLGSIATFTIAFLYGTFRYKITKTIIYISLISFTVFSLLFFFNYVSEEFVKKSIIYFFSVIGTALIIVLVIYLLKLLFQDFKSFILSDNFVVFLFVSSLSLFIILFAPFMATRHILLVVPFLLLFGHSILEKSSKKINLLAVTITLVLGILLGISDYTYSNYYRTMANEISLKTNKTVWTVGHWGWQWYSNKKGMKTYSRDDSKVEVGDYLVIPNDIGKQKLNIHITTKLVKKKWKEASVLTFFSGNEFASLYNSFINKPPWTLSVSPIDTVFIFKVDRIKNELEVVISNIKSNKKWFDSVKEKAKKRDISIDSMLIIDAQWVIKEQEKKNNN